MTQHELDDTNQLASEYVLGTLSAAARRELERRLPEDDLLRDAVQRWEQRLLPLTTLVDPVTPSSRLWPRIEAGLATQPAPAAVGATQSDLRTRFGAIWNNLNLWRTAAAVGFCAASVMAFQFAPGFNPPPANYMVVLSTPQDKAPGWIVQTGADRQLHLIPLAQTAIPEQKSMQFWTKGEGWSGPVSLGLVTPGQSLSVALDKLPPLQQNQLFEITLEPAQGSPIGRPTGPILYIGRAIKVA